MFTLDVFNIISMNFRIWTIRNLTVFGTAEHDAGCRRWMATCEPGPVSLPSLSLPVEQLLVLSIQNAPYAWCRGSFSWSCNIRTLTVAGVTYTVTL
jgi:hypothetical protein